MTRDLWTTPALANTLVGADFKSARGLSRQRCYFLPPKRYSYKNIPDYLNPVVPGKPGTHGGAQR